MATSSPQFIGFSFPFRSDPVSGFPAAATDADLIKQSLLQLVLTGSGERVMRPAVGSGVYSYLFEDNNALLQERISLDLSSLIGRFEPRVALTGITVTPGDPSVGGDPARVDVVISYVILATGQSAQATLTFTKAQ